MPHASVTWWAADFGVLFLPQDNDLIRHNLVVFRNGEGALKTLPPLVDVIPEARLNLVIYYLRTDEIQQVCSHTSLSLVASSACVQ